MLRIDPKWGETAESLFRRAIEAPHKRLRERYLALALIALGEPAIKVAKKLGRSRGTVEAWVHKFNAQGLDGIEPNWKGNPGTILSEEELEQLRNAVKKSPRDVGFKNGRWTGRLVAAFVYERFGKKISIRTAIRYLHRLGFKLKRARKKFKKADPEKQKRFAKETLSVNYCWLNRTALVRSFNGFVASMSKRANEVLKRCVPDMHGFICL